MMKELIVRSISIPTMLKMLDLHNQLLQFDLDQYEFLSVKNYEGWTLYLSIEDKQFVVDNNTLSLEEVCIFLASNEFSYEFIKQESEQNDSIYNVFN